MGHTDRRFTSGEEKLLKQTKEAKLIAMDAIPTAPPDSTWNTVHLRFDSFGISSHQGISRSEKPSAPDVITSKPHGHYCF